MCILGNLESKTHAQAQCMLRKSLRRPKISPGAYSVQAWLTVKGGSWHSTNLQRLGEVMVALAISLCLSSLYLCCSASVSLCFSLTFYLSVSVSSISVSP